MSNKNLSTVANDVIEAYGITATNILNSYRFGGSRIGEFVDARFAGVMNRGSDVLRGVRSNLVEQQQRVSGYCVKGVHFGTERAQTVVGVAVDLATKGVSLLASNASRLDRAASLNAIDTINRMVMPAANVISKVAERIEEGSSSLVKRVAGSQLPAKAVATRTLNATTRKAAATRKRVAKTATREVSKAVAEAATTTSNAARRAARTAKTASKRAGAVVAKGATETSNAARRVARKAKATANAA